MFVAAMLDLGADQDVLMKALRSIPAKGFKIKISRVQKSGIDCADFDVILDKEHENHDHDMAYLFGPAPAEEIEGHEHHHDHDHHDHDDDHHHDHDHDHDHHHHHEHRHLADVRKIISGTDMTDSAKELANRIFTIIAEAESKAHHLPIEEVHFHEVGAIDSIVDVIAAAVTFDNLGFKDVIVPKLCEGTGTVRCQHGVLPIPVPATLNIVTKAKMPLEIMNVKGEYVTPTGAAIAAAICTSHTLPASFLVKSVGLGAGKRDYKEKANFLRAAVVETEDKNGVSSDEIVVLKTDTDDCTGEILGYVSEKLMKAGARDVHFSPVFMKKNRPAWEITVLCDDRNKEDMEKILFTETSTIGIREYSHVVRKILGREERTMETPWGVVSLKYVHIGDETKAYPEYETVKKLAEKHHVPLYSIYRYILGQLAAAPKK